MHRLTCLLASTCLFAAPALAQEAGSAKPDAADPPSQHVDPHTHHHGGEEIVVTGHLVRELDLLAGKTVVSGTELQRDLRPQLGDTLAKQAGVSATSFSPGASRPVLRGFQGERIRVLTDGIGSIDVSNTSADHAVTIDPLTAERIEVLRGPAVLLFGGQAIGGAVNVIDRRIPRTVPEDGHHIDVTGGLGSAADERSIGAAADLAVGGGLVLHVDGSFRKSDDLRVGGYVLSPELRAEQLEIAEEELEEGHAEEAAEALELASLRGKIPNSATEQKSGGLGVALIRDNFNIGASVSVFDSNYGVPMRPGAEHHHEGEEGEEGAEEEEEEGHGEAPVSIDLRQVRGDLRGEYKFDEGFLEGIRLRVGAADYEHTEFEGEEVGTVFKSNGVEGRLELVQRDRNAWRGASGAQYFHRDFKAVGAEAFLPPNTTSQLGLFTLQEFELGAVGVEAAARIERSNAESKSVAIERSFTALSGALGASYALAQHVEAGINLSRTERAPSAEELFSNGPHIATQAFEVGNPNLRKEKSVGAEAYFRVDRRTLEMNLTGFVNWFDNFIYEAATGQEQDELPVFQYFQRDATYYGFEAEISAPLFQVGGFRFVGDAVADYVRATVKGAGPVPRIPPLRLLGGLEAQSDRIDGRVEVEWVDDQKRIAQFETPTDGHTLVNASLAWRPWGKKRETVVVLSASNLFDVDARRHASFTKGFVPMAGRDIRLSARFSF
ncbi:TonB-dependent receptor [Sphingomonas sp.]|uniref:TonB-dependent receptor n=1 Tax=Sphingomonas sp. TaxID=28214 RepID=UPI00180C5462|nr:TonB-dependent receptor [Sphingomonas sp.]MBA3510363.1 TonB-dependent receptor [Sphingomonas sp.]